MPGLLPDTLLQIFQKIKFSSCPQCLSDIQLSTTLTWGGGSCGAPAILSAYTACGGRTLDQLSRRSEINFASFKFHLKNND